MCEMSKHSIVAGGALRSRASPSSRMAVSSPVIRVGSIRSKCRVFARVFSMAKITSRNSAAFSNSCLAAAAAISTRSVPGHSRDLPFRKSQASVTRHRYSSRPTWFGTPYISRRTSD